jgi:uncharacterized protein YbjT (DUF2867 family)
MTKSAALIGATGLVGQNLLSQLLQDKRYQKVWVYARSEPDNKHPKLVWKQGDLLSEALFEAGIPAEDVFCAIGTTRAKTPDLEKYRAIDYGIPVRAAQMGLKGKMRSFLVVSSLGANAQSSFFYPRLKGEMEQALLAMQIPKLHLFRPSFILGERKETRWGENIGKALFAFLAPIIPSRYRGLSAEKIAKAMVCAANQSSAPQVLETKAIKRLSEKRK